MKKYLAIVEEEVSQKNPYYHPSISNIESEYITNVIYRHVFFSTDEELAKFISQRSNNTGKNCSYYIVQEIKPTVKTSLTLSIE